MTETMSSSTSMSADISSVKEYMITKFHVSLHEEWLMECVKALREAGGVGGSGIQGGIDDDFLWRVYEQVLNGDLRDSVNGVGDSTRQLREAIRSSLLPPPAVPPKLPAGFKIMVQLDELVDVSTNAQHRAERGASRSQGFGNPGFYGGRCLKLAMTDGWVKDGEVRLDG